MGGPLEAPPLELPLHAPGLANFQLSPGWGGSPLEHPQTLLCMLQGLQTFNSALDERVPLKHTHLVYSACSLRLANLQLNPGIRGPHLEHPLRTPSTRS